ncbi:MAG: formate/nitrite transporter family protein [Mycoplasma sp.]
MKNLYNAAGIWFHKFFKLDKEHFAHYNEYTTTKLKYNLFKKLMLAILGGAFVAIGYTGTLVVYGFAEGAGDLAGLYKFLGACLFPVGLLLCIFLGGSLYTSNCMGFISLLYKDRKGRHYMLDLFITLVGNGLGCLLIALIVWGSGLFGGVGGSALTSAGADVIKTALHKIDASHGNAWWNNLIGGILCNIIIVGTTLVNINCKNKGVSTFVIFLMLVVFVLSGYQHVVANLYVFSIGGLLSTGAANSSLMFTGLQAGEVFYVNLIPSMIGNLIGGVMIAGAYLCAGSYVYNKKKHQLKENTTIEIEDSSEVKQEATDKK